jgi:predicted dienelactone hydrolase
MLTVLICALLIAQAVSSGSHSSPRGHDRQRGGNGGSKPSGKAQPAPKPPFGVAELVLRLAERRLTSLPSGVPAFRPLLTDLLYPVTRAGHRLSGRLPLVVFAHGFDLAPSTYRPLLDEWVRHGYVVAAPVFPREASGSPGGPDESDLPNQPGDVSFLISWLSAASLEATSPLRGIVDPSRIAVSGHSDGGDTTLAVAYGGGYRDGRIKAAMVLSGAEMPGTGQPYFARGGPPLLAVQGTADPINPPSQTNAFFAAAPRPKYLLELPGATHLAPYTGQQPELGIVERVTLGFLDRYLKADLSARSVITVRGNRAAVATLNAYP